MTSIRTFIAFDTPLKIKEEIRLLQDELNKSQADVKWESIEKFHATIKFLGDVGETLLPTVITLCEATLQQYSSFDVTYHTLGCFPNKTHPRVIWVGCKTATTILHNIKNALDGVLVSHGFEIEKRAFHPHITLGRVKNPKGLSHLTSMLEKLTFEPRSAIIHDILIMKSMLKPSGSEYSVLKTIKLQN